MNPKWLLAPTVVMAAGIAYLVIAIAVGTAVDGEVNPADGTMH